MSSFNYLLKAALAAAAIVATVATGEAVDNPAYEEMKRPLPLVGIMMGGLIIGMIVVAVLLQWCSSYDRQQTASCQPNRKRILPLMSIEPALKFTNGLTLAGGADHPECTICLSELLEGEEIRILSNCRHGFHLRCIETWLSSRNSCPTCRSNCLITSVKNNPPEQQQQQQQQQQNNEVDLEAANTTDIEMSTATTSIE